MPEQAQNPKSFYTHQKRSSFADRAFVSDYKGREWPGFKAVQPAYKSMGKRY